MSFEEPTYEEYKNANAWAKFKYKYGIVVQVMAWLCFVFVIIYMVMHGEAIARHPLIYGADKYNVSCTCYTPEGRSIKVNGSRLKVGSKPLPENLPNISSIKEVQWVNKT